MPTDGQAADIRGPRGGAALPNGARQITAIPVTTASQTIDISGVNYFNGTHYQGKILRLICDQDLFYFWCDAAETVDETATAGTNPTRQCDLLPLKTRVEEAPAGTQIAFKGAAAGTLRISIVETVGK